MSGFYIPNLEIPQNCMSCKYRDASYGNCCELMIDNPADSFEEQYRLCPIRKLCENAIPVPYHRRLIDAHTLSSMYDPNTDFGKSIRDIIKDCPTIIPEDTEEQT